MLEAGYYLMDCMDGMKQFPAHLQSHAEYIGLAEGEDL